MKYSLILFVLLFSLTGCNQAKDESYIEGSQNGEVIGYSKGYAQGIIEGETTGYSIGYEEGYNEGILNSYDTGFDEGLQWAIDNPSGY